MRSRRAEERKGKEQGVGDGGRKTLHAHGINVYVLLLLPLLPIATIVFPSRLKFQLKKMKNKNPLCVLYSSLKLTVCFEFLPFFPGQRHFFFHSFPRSLYRRVELNSISFFLSLPFSFFVCALNTSLTLCALDNSLSCLLASSYIYQPAKASTASAAQVA